MIKKIRNIKGFTLIELLIIIAISIIIGILVASIAMVCFNGDKYNTQQIEIMTQDEEAQQRQQPPSPIEEKPVEGENNKL